MVFYELRQWWDTRDPHVGDADWQLPQSLLWKFMFPQMKGSLRDSVDLNGDTKIKGKTPLLIIFREVMQKKRGKNLHFVKI